MLIKQLAASNVRSLDFIQLAPIDGINVIVGKNNDGKTTLLESIYFASSLKSFKSVSSSTLVKNGANSLKIQIKCSNVSIKSVISIEKTLKGSNSILFNEKRTALKQLLHEFPVLALNFGAENVVTGTSDDRRSLLDWGTFHVEPNFLEIYKNYQKALKQRNSLLKKSSLDNLPYWTNLLSTLGEELDKLRRDYFIGLNEAFVDYKDIILSIDSEAYDDIRNSEIEYYSGWNKDQSLQAALEDSLDKDKAMKHTTCGPHRADLLFSSSGLELKSISSMSTQVVTGLLLVLSQSKVFHVKHGHYPVVLIDDLFFGIDDKNLVLVINLLKHSNAQCFITAPDLYKAKLKDASDHDEKIRIYEFKSRELVDAEK